MLSGKASAKYYNVLRVPLRTDPMTSTRRSSLRVTPPSDPPQFLHLQYQHRPPLYTRSTCSRQNPHRAFLPVVLICGSVLRSIDISIRRSTLHNFSIPRFKNRPLLLYLLLSRYCCTALTIYWRLPLQQPDSLHPPQSELSSVSPP